LKKLQILITIAFIISIISSSVYAAEPNTGLGKSTGIAKVHDRNFEKGEKDPLKRLANRKENINKKYKEGKITKEKADELTQKINKHIAKVKEFNSLSLPQKKEHLSAKFKAHIEKQIIDGKIAKGEGEKIIKDFNTKLNNWNGKEFPGFMHKSAKHKK